MPDSAPPSRWWTAATRTTAVLVGLVCGVILWTFLPPVVLFPYFALASAVLLALGGIWVILGLIGWVRFRALRPSVTAPVLVLITVAAVAASVPSQFAFAVSKNRLTAVARECPKTFDDRRIGVYRVWQIRPVDGGCLFYIEGGLIDSIGLAHLPNGAPYLGEPRHDGDIGYREYHGDWYRFVQRF